MDGECLKADPFGTRREDDRISELPEEIITFILSLLSLKEAAATSILSPRWSNLWKQTHILNFSYKILNLNNSSNVEEGSSWDAESCQYIKLVNSVLKSHKALFLKQFKISFYVNKSAQSHVDKWLDFLFSRRLERLELDFRCWKERQNKVVLKEYLLKQKGLISYYSDIVMFKSLKRLSLKCFQLSGEDIKVLLHNCPLLKALIINAATLTSDVEIRGANLSLKVLEIYACLGRKGIKVSAPNLTWIRFDDTTSPGKLLFENTSNVLRAGFMVRNPEYLPHHFASQVACFISQLRVLTLSLYYPKEFLGKEFPQMPKLKRLVVEDYGDYDHGGFLHLTALIWASPRLQVFYLKFNGEYKDSTSQMEVEEAIMNVKRRRHRNLKTFKFRGPCLGMSDHVVELVTYISKKCLKLEKVIIGRIFMVSPDIKAEVEARDCIKLQLHPKLRRRIQLQISQPI